MNVVDNQLAHFQDPVDRLWWLAQVERGIENADIGREPRYGSERVLNEIARVYENDNQKEKVYTNKSLL